MPTESAVPLDPSDGQSAYSPSPSTDLKCSLCGLGSLGSTSGRNADDVVVLSDPIERICGSCVRAQGLRHGVDDISLLGLGLRNGDHEDHAIRGRRRERDSPDSTASVSIADDIEEIREVSTVEPLPIPPHPKLELSSLHSQSLPSQHTRPWDSGTKPCATINEAVTRPVEKRGVSVEAELDIPPNPLLDVTKARVPNIGRGALHAGSIFRGTQTSGRSAYEVEVRFLDVNFPESSCSGYLSISHLTDAHPHLTTFFTGEIIGPQHGFITGAKFGATEHDDMRHWGRFEQFRRPSTRGDMMQPELLFRDPLPDRTRGQTASKERDFVFLRIKERFLVPDHTVRDISGASFAGFYYAMVDLSPAPGSAEPMSPMSPVCKSPSLPSAPTLPRRTSSSGEARSSSRPTQGRRRQSSNKLPEPVQTEATIRGYYFHSLNQEPFQELFLSHVPSRSSSTMEMR